MRLRYIITALMCIVSLSAMAQRRITPVEKPDKKKNTQVTAPVDSVNGRPASVIETTDIAGHTILVDTISGLEYRDTILTTAPKLVYPRFESVSVGANLWDPLMRVFGQKYGLIGFWAELSLHNWIKPVIEVGLGEADYRPDDNRYHYKSGMAPYFKLGVNYNFLYNSTPDYSVYLALRYGLSSFSFEVDDVTVSHPYWREDVPMTVPSQHCTAGFIDVMIGLKVMIVKNIYVGWAVGVHKVIHNSKMMYGDPWYVPGFGTRTSLFTGSLSVSYVLPVFRKNQVTPPPGADPEPQQ